MGKVLESVAEQLPPGCPWSVLIVDNGSQPALAPSVLAPLRSANLPARIVRENRPGLIHARIRAIEETDSAWLLFIDDDNVLFRDYLKSAVDFIHEHEEVGCFGGKILLPPETRDGELPAAFRGFFAIRDFGEQTLICPSRAEHEPCGAGLMVRRDVLDYFKTFTRQRALCESLGRKPHIMASCEDSLLVRCAYRLGLKSAYVPNLVLQHYIDAERFRWRALFDLVCRFGESNAILNWVSAEKPRCPREYRSGFAALRTVVYAFFQDAASGGLRYAIAKVGYHRAEWRIYRVLSAHASPFRAHEKARKTARRQVHETSL